MLANRHEQPATSLSGDADQDDGESSMSCWRCNDTGRVDASRSDWIGDRECPDCGPKTYEDYDHDD
jgi:hypothetical protein